MNTPSLMLVEPPELADETASEMLDWLASHSQSDQSALRRLRPKVEMNVQRLLQLFARHGVLADD